MSITNLHVYNLENAIVASGYPMITEYDPVRVDREVQSVRQWITQYGNMKERPLNAHVNRAIRLCAAPSNSGHCNFLSGILVTMDVTATNVWWMQCERYHFVQIVSSMSKMHKLRSIREKHEDVMFHSKVSPFIAADYFDDDSFSNVEDDEELAYSCPMGMLLTAQITTNYLQLRNIYNQRKNHKLQEWRTFCNSLLDLPFGDIFIAGQ